MNGNHILGLVRRNMYLWFRDVDRLFDAFWWSFFDIAIWGFMGSYYTQNTDPLVGQQIVTSLILWTALARSQWEISSTMIIESWDKNLVNIFTAPVSLSEFMASSIILGFAKVLLVFGFTAVVTLILIGFNVFTLSWWIVPLMGNIFLAGIWMAFIINSLILRFGKNAITLAWSLVFLVNPLSGVMYPVSALPQVFQQIAKLLPSSYVFEAMRGLMYKGRMDTGLLVASLGLNILYIGISVAIYSATFAKARERGWLIKLT